ncbi:tetratricopeptide repeat protein, partial [bacterium BMS3Abin03]|nr:tetratricopeptide repeat protein [bacterium BMS3Abin03]
GKLEESVKSYKSALRITPDNHQIWFNLAETFFEMGKWLEALNSFDECLRINPVDATSMYGKAKVNFLLSRTHEAIECLKKAFKIDPGIEEEFTADYPDVKSSKLFKKLLGEN